MRPDMSGFYNFYLDGRVTGPYPTGDEADFGPDGEAHRMEGRLRVVYLSDIGLPG